MSDFKIRRVFCWIVTEAQTGDEGLPTIPSDMGDLAAAFGAYRRTVEGMRPYLRSQQYRYGQIRLVMFSGLSEVDETTETPPASPPGPKRIEQIWAYLATKKGVPEGIAGAMDREGRWVPLVAADRDRYESIRLMAAMMRGLGARVRLVRFSKRTELGALRADA